MENSSAESAAAARRDRRQPRIVALDFLRGLMLLVMMMNHLIYFPLWSLRGHTYSFTFQPLGFVSAAEGFVLVSGILFGLVYGRKYADGGAAAFDRAAVGRLGAIYGHYVGVYFIIALLFALPSFAGAWPQNWESQEMLKENPWGMFALGLVFVHQTGLLDILPMYFVFVALGIAAMPLLARGRQKTLLALSLTLWLAGQLRPQLYMESQTGLHLGWFELAAWQLLFVAGMIFGYARARNPDFRLPIRGAHIFAALAVCAPLFFYRHQFSLLEETLPNASFFDARNLGAVRVVNAAALAYLIYALAQWRPNWLRGRFCADIGGAALRVFCYHALVCYALMPLRPDLAELPIAAQISIWAALVASLYLPVLATRLWTPARRAGD